MTSLSKAVVAAAVAMCISLLLIPAAQAADWFQLQNTEPAKAKLFRIWGFAQPTYEASFGDKVQGATNPLFNGQHAIFNNIAPDHKSTSSFVVKRARIGVRGVMPKTHHKINYFLLAEFGHNGITKNASAVELTDASVTLNYVPGFRLRVGQFKYPSPEESQQAFPLVDPFIEFTTVSTQLVLGRSFKVVPGSTAKAAGRTKMIGTGGVDAFRDTGAELFDWYDWGHWEAAYAVMLGNGSTLNAQDRNSKLQWSTRIQGSYIFGGKGPFRQDITGWLWYQTGKRTFQGTDYNRRREGAGVVMRLKPWRVSAAYLRGTGVIFTGFAAPFHGVTGVASHPSVALGNQNKARGWYVEGQYNLPQLHDLPQLGNVQLDLRYDAYDRLPNDPKLERRFHTWTVGVQYAFTPKVKFRLNYLIRSLKPGNPTAAGHNARVITDTIGNMAAAQIMVWF